MSNPYYNKTFDVTPGTKIVSQTLEDEFSSVAAGFGTVDSRFPSISAPVTATQDELNILDGATVSTAELNILDGATVSTAELNILHGATVSTAELNRSIGVTSPIQTQLDLKAPVASPALTGVPTAPTAVAGTSTTQIATTAFVVATSFSTSLPGQTGNAGKFVTTDGANASWSYAGISQVTTATGNTTLTSTPTLLKITPAASGVVVTLPDATTCHVGGPLYVIENASPTYNVLLAHSVSGYVIQITAGATATVCLIDKSSADGVWNVTCVATSGKGLTAADLLLVGGGGGGSDGGGGGGGVRQISGIATGSTGLIVIGSGGAAGQGDNGSPLQGSPGTPTTAFGYTASGGGGGGKGNTNGSSGGGGGGGGVSASVTTAGGAGNSGTYTPAEGYAGGGNAGFTGSPFPAGGGGGAGGSGGNATGNTVSGAGGQGVTSSISGASVGYGGGGGGGVRNLGGSGGGATHGGGAGRVSSGGPGADGVAGTGGGGGGGTQGYFGGAGGSGVCILRYPDTMAALTSTTGSPTVTVTGGYRIYKWTSSGSFTV